MEKRNHHPQFDEQVDVYANSYLHRGTMGRGGGGVLMEPPLVSFYYGTAKLITLTQFSLL